MLKALAILRTGFLVFILGYAGVIWMRTIVPLSDCAVQLSRSLAVNLSLWWALGIAIAGIAVDTLIGWLWSWRAAKKKALASPTPSAAP
jgi:hypothetical protein